MHSPIPPDHLVTVKEAMEILHVSRRTMYRLLNGGSIASIHIGAARRIVRASITDYIAEGLLENLKEYISDD